MQLNTPTRLFCSLSERKENSLYAKKKGSILLYQTFAFLWHGALFPFEICSVRATIAFGAWRYAHCCACAQRPRSNLRSPRLCKHRLGFARLSAPLAALGGAKAANRSVPKKKAPEMGASSLAEKERFELSRRLPDLRP